jgi:uncharacterized membrane protein YgdD (TMEM256/DUF423 family)
MRHAPAAMKPWISLGALNALLAVAAGAFGAHALRAKIPADRLAGFETGARYHMYHALGLIAVGLLAAHRNESGNVPGAAMLTGIVLFSGSLYALALSGVRVLGAITPFGGIAFMTGWAALAWMAWK